MSSERKNTGLRVALASYDVHQLRVWHQYIVEQSAEILCSEYRSGEELLQSLKQGRNTEVVVLGGPLEDMDSREFLERMSRLPQKPLLLLQDNARRERTAVSSLSPDGPCYLIRQSSLKELLASLLTAAGQESGTLEQRFGRMYQEWGIIQPDSNCDYLTEAVLIAGQSKGKLAIRKEILQGVAEHHNVTVAAVDSGLRRLIDALETRQMPAWKAFKEKTHLAGQKVTAGKLIYTLRAPNQPGIRILTQRQEAMGCARHHKSSRRAWSSRAGSLSLSAFMRLGSWIRTGNICRCTCGRAAMRPPGRRWPIWSCRPPGWSAP